MSTENGQPPKDSRLRFRLQPGSMLERTVTKLKESGRDKERQRLEAAICAFWAPHAYQNSDEFQGIALQSILELSDQILEICLLADLPIDQLDPMSLKARAISLKQKQKKPVTTADIENGENSGSISQTIPTQTQTPAANIAKPKAAKTPVATKQRESLFDD